MRPVPLTVLKGGINRLRTKGAPRADQLYDLLNGYIDQAGGVTQREGTIRVASLTSQTVGLCAVNGVFHVFATSLVSVPAGYQCDVLAHPTDSALTLSRIWYASPFMGFLYVVAEFSNGDVFHYWLQSSGSWQANTVYYEGDIVLPTTPNGLAYQSQRTLAPYALWSSNTQIAVNTIVEPTTYTGFVYKATAVAGANPHTGATEPTWPTVEDGTVQEFGDFDTSSTAAETGDGSTSAVPLSSNITGRYGNSSTIAGQTGVSSSITTDALASTAVTTWAAGTTYAPGSVVRPTTSQGAFVNAIPNGDFEAGNNGTWTLTGGATIQTNNPYQGTYCLQLSANNNEVSATMVSYGTVAPGQSVTVSAYANPNNTGSNLSIILALRFYDASDTFISESRSPFIQGGGYRPVSHTAVAPANAARCRVRLIGANGTSTKTGYVDAVTWNLEQPAAVSNFLYEAVQASAASSSTTEPAWPTVSGNTVVDGGVTWKAIGTSIITWQAIPIMKSGGSEPSWPTSIGNSVYNGTMSWVAINRQITDAKCPNTVAVAAGASHIFAGDDDITSYSAAVDPTDWTSSNNAGYLPTGLNNYGNNPVAMLALYRSNLMVFNSGGYQMWQIDPDPQNMALLDAQPVGSIWPLAAQAVANDLLFLTEVGVRNLGTVGATANMQIGDTGQPVDPIVRAALRAGTYDPISLYYPGRGQYWLIFGPQAFVLTINGKAQKSWSRYVFPQSIEAWTLSEGKLYLRTANDLVWQLDDATLVDDFGGANTAFTGRMQWPYLDTGVLGYNKMLVGLDLVGAGAVTIQVGWNENDPTSFSDDPNFPTSLSVTAPYSVAAADTVPGTPIPIPLNAPSYSLILTFAGNRVWNWQATNLYVTDAGGGGLTG